MNHDFTQRVQNYVAETAIGSSAPRNQGAKDVIKTAREYMKSIELAGFVTDGPYAFLKKLDWHTEKLRRLFRPQAQHWGAARKALNLFLMDSCHNRHLYSHYGLSKIEQWLEVPLESFVAKGLRRDLPASSLPKWNSIKALRQPQSNAFQEAAKLLAASRGVARVHLDLYYFRQDDAQRVQNVTPRR
jgi:hypothetical protein